MNLINIMLSKRCQKLNSTYCMTSRQEVQAQTKLTFRDTNQNNGSL